MPSASICLHHLSSRGTMFPSQLRHQVRHLPQRRPRHREVTGIRRGWEGLTHEVPTRLRDVWSGVDRVYPLVPFHTQTASSAPTSHHRSSPAPSPHQSSHFPPRPAARIPRRPLLSSRSLKCHLNSNPTPPAPTAPSLAVPSRPKAALPHPATACATDSPLPPWSFPPNRVRTSRLCSIPTFTSSIPREASRWTWSRPWPPPAGACAASPPSKPPCSTT